MAQYPFRKSDIAAAGDTILKEIARKNGGSLPATGFGLYRLCVQRYDLGVCKSYGIECAQLVQDFQPSERSNPYAGEWCIYYPPTGSALRRLRYLIHELAEYIAVTDHPNLGGLFDDNAGGRVYRYDGGDDPGNLRHLVACYVEKKYVKWLLSL